MTVEIVEYLDRKGRSPFSQWFNELPAAAAAKVVVAIERIGRGLMGDVKPGGSGISERRIDFGPGYRVYFGSVKKGNITRMVILVGGGVKKRQKKDIETAQYRWKDCKSRRRKGEE